MNGKLFNKKLRRLALTLFVLAVLVTPSFGSRVTVRLVAKESVATMPDGTMIPMWGYFLDTGQACNAPSVWSVGPQIDIPPSETALRITLRNCLPAPTSLVITGQKLPVKSTGETLTQVTKVDAQGRDRVIAFTRQAGRLSPRAPATGWSRTYNFKKLKEGTYLYSSGSHPALQQQMGLYGAVRVERVAGQAYGNAYDQEEVLLYSEIDPVLHDPPQAAKPLNYKPTYFLVNGQPYTGATPAVNAGDAGGTVLLRMLNAGLMTHVPTLMGDYLKLIAEDGNAYPYMKTEYSLLLTAGKTVDALFMPTAAGTYSLFDRRLNLTSNGATDGGLFTQLDVGPTPP